MLKGFVQIQEFPDYYINQNGQVYSTKRNKLLTVVKNPNGYSNVRLYIDGKQKNLLLHRILAYVFLNLPTLNKDCDLEVDHRDSNIENNSLSNLQVMTQKEHREKTTRDRKQKSWEREVSCKVCGVSISARSTHCHTCSSYKVKNESITSDDIEYFVKKYGWSSASKKLGYSDNGLRKRYKTLSNNDPKTLKKIK